MKFPWLLVRETFVITKNISYVFEEAFVLKYVLIVSGFLRKNGMHDFVLAIKDVVIEI